MIGSTQSGRVDLTFNSTQEDCLTDCLTFLYSHFYIWEFDESRLSGFWELLGGAVCGLPPPLVVCYSAFGRGRQQHFRIFISIDISSKYIDALLKEQSTCLLWLNEMLYKLSFGPSTKMPLFGAQKCSFGPQINVMEASDFWRHRYISKRSFSTWLLSLTCGEI